MRIFHIFEFIVLLMDFHEKHSLMCNQHFLHRTLLFYKWMHVLKMLCFSCLMLNIQEHSEHFVILITSGAWKGEQGWEPLLRYGIVFPSWSCLPPEWMSPVLSKVAGTCEKHNNQTMKEPVHCGSCCGHRVVSTAPGKWASGSCPSCLHHCSELLAFQGWWWWCECHTE